MKNPLVNQQRMRETVKRVSGAVRDLEALLEHHEKTSVLLVEVLATTRSLVDVLGSRDALKMLSRECPRLAETAARVQDLSRQISAEVDDLQALISASL